MPQYTDIMLALMTLSFLIDGLSLFLSVLSWMIILRIVISWIAPGSQHPALLFIFETTEQIIAPIRRHLPRGQGAWGMIDWSPLVALILLDLLRYLIVAGLGNL